MLRGLVEKAARARPAVSRWRVGATGLLLVSGGWVLIPDTFDAWAPAVNPETALLVCLLAGFGLGVWRVRGRGGDAGEISQDDSTGLPRRDQADAIASRLIERGAREGSSRLALVLVELEDSSGIRRRYGDAAVGALLRIAGETLGSECRAADLPFRYSEHTLGVYLHCADHDQAQAFGRRIRMLLASQQLDWQGDILKPVVGMAIVMHRTGQGLAQLQASGSKALALPSASP